MWRILGATVRTVKGRGSDSVKEWTEFTDGAWVVVKGATLSFKSVGGNDFGGSGSMSLNRLGNCRLGLRVRRSDSGKESLSSHGSEPDAESPGRSMIICKGDQSHGWAFRNILALPQIWSFLPCLHLWVADQHHQSCMILDPEVTPRPGSCFGWSWGAVSWFHIVLEPWSVCSKGVSCARYILWNGF